MAWTCSAQRSMRVIAVTAVFVAGCDAGVAPGYEGNTWRWDETHSLPTAPWQGVYVTARHHEYSGDELVPCDPDTCDSLTERDAEPIVLDSDGARVELEHVLFAAGRADELAWGWRPAGGFAPGHYTVVGLVPVPELELDLGFDVADIGATPEIGTLAGRSWQLTGVRNGPLGFPLEPFFRQSPGTELFLQLVDTGTASAELQVVMRRDGEDCSLAHDSASPDESGLLTGTIASMTIDVVGHPPAQAEHLSLGVGWPSVGEPQGRFDALVDVEGFAPFVTAGMTGQEVCDLLASAFAVNCTTCADGSATCLALSAEGLDFVEVSSDLIATDLPACSTDPGEGLSGAVDANGQLLCGCSQSGRPSGALFAALVALLAVRRRSH